MKLITYILYNKSRETEKVMKFGDKRYVNNKLNVDTTIGSIVINVNGEYFGIKRSTTIQKTKTGEVKGAPTVLAYHKLDSPDDEFNDDNSLENLIEDERRKTQAGIEKAIGTYENFMRVVMTTSDSLNEILSGDKAIFIDSLLYDSGLDIFDHKLSAFKEYFKELSSVPRVTCNVERSEELIKTLETEVNEINNKINDVENVKIPKVEASITKGEAYHEDLIKKLFKIDDEIYNLDIENTEIKINTINGEIDVFKEKWTRLDVSISILKESYDEEKLIELLNKKDSHRDEEFGVKNQIKDVETKIRDIEYTASTLRGDNVRLKEEGGKLKKQIEQIKSNTNCPTCGQLLDDNHQEHIKEQVKEIEKEMFSIAKKIQINAAKVIVHETSIGGYKTKIADLNGDIKKMSLEMEDVLNEIGVLTNDKNEVDRRKSLVADAEKVPLQIENLELQKQSLNQKINLYKQSLKQIEENQKINLGIDAAKKRLGDLKYEKDNYKDDIYSLNTQRGQKVVTIRETGDLIVIWIEQEKQDNILSIYKKCIHRDGIPTQLLKTYAIPKINKGLAELLEDVSFSIWLDDDDLKLKLAYNDSMDAVIDAISASGKERTFASVALKFALNQINTKSKPTIFLLDEVMGKLTEDSVSEFVGILQAIKERMNKVLIVEHNHEVDPDYLIEVIRDDKGISTLKIE